MTLTRLAALAGTSVATVSKAFAGSCEISKETKETIFALAKKEGCFDKYYKAPRERPLIALLAPEPEGEHYGREIGQLERALCAAGADTVIAFTRFDPEREARLFRELVYQMKVDGTVLWGTGTEIRNPDEHPLIALSSTECSPHNADTVWVNYEGGILSLVRELKARGYKQVGFIGERLTTSTERLLRDAMRRMGFPVHDKYFILSKERFEAAGKDGMAQLLAGGALPEVIVTAYDQIAHGAMKHARECGYRIPEDISFVGITDISATRFADVPLSTLRIDFDSCCERIVSLLLRRIENKHYRSRERLVVPVSLVLRASLK